MKSFGVILLAASLLGGCAELRAIGTAASLVTKSVTNPVTKKDLYEAESLMSIGFTALQTYKNGCIQKLVDSNCAANVAAVQQYTRQLPPYLNQAREFVKNNDQVNAAVAYNQFITLYNNAKQTAQSFGIGFGNGA